MGIFYGNMNPDATFTSDIGSITRLATSAPFARYLQEEIFQQSLSTPLAFCRPTHV